MMGKEMTPQEALNILIAGNRRFARGESFHPHCGFARRREVIQSQNPFAVIVACSDSRVPPEIIFDCGIGDLFVVRVAGNIIDSVVMGSIVYAVHHLACPLVGVLGHEMCGAVSSSLASDNEIVHEPPALIKLLAIIRENIPNSLKKNKGKEQNLSSAICENTRAVVEYIKSDTTIQSHIDNGTLEVRQALYSLSSGEVTWE